MKNTDSVNTYNFLRRAWFYSDMVQKMQEQPHNADYIANHLFKICPFPSTIYAEK